MLPWGLAIKMIPQRTTVGFYKFRPQYHQDAFMPPEAGKKELDPLSNNRVNTFLRMSSELFHHQCELIRGNRLSSRMLIYPENESTTLRVSPSWKMVFYVFLASRYSSPWLSNMYNIRLLLGIFRMTWGIQNNYWFANIPLRFCCLEGFIHNVPATFSSVHTVLSQCQVNDSASRKFKLILSSYFFNLNFVPGMLRCETQAINCWWLYF